MMKTRIVLWIVPALLLWAAAAPAQNYRLMRTLTGAAGAGLGTSATWTVGGTTGQPAAGSSSSTGYSGGWGFWSEYDALKTFYVLYYPVNAGWNMVSLPGSVSNDSTKAVFPSAVSRAFEFTTLYNGIDTLVVGKGYWLKFGGGGSVPVIHGQVTLDTIDVKAGWNMIGSISQPLSTGSVVQVPPGIVASSYFGYSNGYFTPPNLEPAKAYWVKASADGKLVLSAGPGAAPSTAAGNGPEARLNELAVGTMHGSVADGPPVTLLFGAESAGIEPAMYDMPPSPPAGATDVRFGTNRYAAFFSSGTDGAQEVPITIRTSSDRAKLAWTMKEGESRQYEIVGRKGTEEVLTHAMGMTGSVVLDRLNEVSYSLRVTDVPLAYDLAQNYPNPFNPSTTIRYQLPADGVVRLTVYDALGQVVATLVDGAQTKGYHAVEWDGVHVASGVYFYRIDAVDAAGSGKAFTQIRKMVLLK